MKKFIISIIGIIMYFIMFSQVEAVGTVSLSSNKSTVDIGDTFNVNINLSGASVATLTARVSFDTSKVEYVSGPSNSNLSGGRVIYTWTDPTGGDSPLTGGTIATFTFRAKAEGNASFGVSGNFFSPDETAVNPSFSGVTVTVQQEQSEVPEGSTGGNIGNTTGGSTGGNIGNNVGGNAGGNTSGSVGTTGNIAGGGNQTTGNTGGTTNNNQQTTKSSNNYLKSLQLDVEGISPTFNKNMTQYYITIPENISNINVTAQPEDSKASVQVSGNTNIQLGNTKISIMVTAENGNKREYVINLTKTSNPELSNASLENLAIENAVLVPEFNADITDYTVEITEDVERLNILAVAQQEAATVTIEGNENLQIGENNIKITVLAQDGETSKIYNIIVIKNEVEEVINEENIDENNEQVQENLSEQVEGYNFWMFLGVGVILVLVFVGIYYYKRRKKV